jgi:hypothetical protein
MTPPPTQACAPQRKPETRRLLPIEWEQEIGYAILQADSTEFDMAAPMPLQEFLYRASLHPLTKLPPNPQA